eukprot:3260404-Alexandrium_andersonii.AAC.1
MQEPAPEPGPARPALAAGPGAPASGLRPGARWAPQDAGLVAHCVQYGVVLFGGENTGQILEALDLAGAPRPDAPPAPRAGDGPDARLVTVGLGSSAPEVLARPPAPQGPEQRPAGSAAGALPPAQPGA